MVELVYAGVEGWKRRAGWQVVVAVVLFAVDADALRLLYIPLLIGLTVGITHAWCLSKMWMKKIPAVTWIGIAALVIVFFLLNLAGHAKGISLAGWIGLGAVCAATMETTFALLVPKVLKVLENTKQLKSRLKFHEYEELRKEPVPQIDSDEAMRRITAILPPVLANNFERSVKNIVKAVPGESDAPTCRSSIGGRPCLPSGVAWPVNQGSPLDYLARVDFSEIPPFDGDHPTRGAVLFFFDIESQPWGNSGENRKFHRVIFDPSPENSSEMESPREIRHEIPLIPLRMEKTRSFCPRSDMMDSYYQFYREVDFETKRTLYHLPEILYGVEQSGNRVVSAPALIQNDMDAELAAASEFLDLPAGCNWTMLFQMESIPDVEWQWGDDGMLYFWIPTADLALKRFDRTWAIVQSP